MSFFFVYFHIQTQGWWFCVNIRKFMMKGPKELTSFFLTVVNIRGGNEEEVSVCVCNFINAAASQKNCVSLLQFNYKQSVRYLFVLFSVSLLLRRQYTKFYSKPFDGFSFFPVHFGMQANFVIDFHI